MDTFSVGAKWGPHSRRGRVESKRVDPSDPSRHPSWLRGVPVGERKDPLNNSVPICKISYKQRQDSIVYDPCLRPRGRIRRRGSLPERRTLFGKWDSGVHEWDSSAPDYVRSCPEPCYVPSTRGFDLESEPPEYRNGSKEGATGTRRRRSGRLRVLVGVTGRSVTRVPSSTPVLSRRECKYR